MAIVSLGTCSDEAYSFLWHKQVTGRTIFRSEGLYWRRMAEKLPDGSTYGCYWKTVYRFELTETEISELREHGEDFNG